MRRFLIAVILLIVYGSLYPWHFQSRELGASPIWILLHGWRWTVSRYLFRDVFTNVIIYIPLGACAYLALDKSNHALWRLSAPVLLAAFISTSIELIQLYVPGRNCSMLDVIANVAGGAIGVVAAILARSATEAVSRKRRSRDPGFTPGVPPDRLAVAVLSLMCAWLLFPFFPSLSRTILYGKLAQFAAAPFSLVGFASGTMCWLLAGRMLLAIDARPAAAWLGALLLAIPAQFLIVRPATVLSDLLGAVAGICCFAIWGKRAKASWVVAGGFLLLLLVRGIAPFRFQADASAFVWIPFASLLESEWRAAVPILLEKLFFYGAAIWALQSAGVRLRVATLIIAAELAAIELVQMHLPGRIPEITDPLLAIFLGVAAMSDRLSLSAIQIDKRAL